MGAGGRVGRNITINGHCYHATIMCVDVLRWMHRDECWDDVMAHCAWRCVWTVSFAVVGDWYYGLMLENENWVFSVVEISISFDMWYRKFFVLGIIRKFQLRNSGLILDSEILGLVTLVTMKRWFRECIHFVSVYILSTKMVFLLL